MGLGPPVLCLYKFMHDQGLFGGIDSVVEIGSQEYDMKLPEYDTLLERVCAGLGRPTPPGRDPQTGRYKGPASDFYDLLGCHYAALDIDARFGSIAFDLNYDTIGGDLRHSSALTTNLGTTEHVFNQHNCFRTIHDLTRPGGLMLHVLPMHNYVNHGLFSYSPVFFDALAAANDYEPIGLWMNAKPLFNLLPMARPRFPLERTMLFALLRRTNADDFVMPLQLSNPMLVHGSMGDRYGTTERRDKKETPRGLRYHGAVHVDLESLDSELLEPDDARLKKMLKLLTKPKQRQAAPPVHSPPEAAGDPPKAAAGDSSVRGAKGRSLVRQLFGSGS
jgi:hypothetical protein